ncbi:MAG: hypothetical protein ACOYY2_12945 [Actinomycetota bacterium]
MNREEARRLLDAANALDPRVRITDVAVDAWRLTLADVPYTPACYALTEHYTHATTVVMPADIRRRVLARAESAAPAGTAPTVPTPPVDPDDVTAYLAWQRAYLAAANRGATAVQAAAHADHTCGVARTPEVLIRKPLPAALAARSNPTPAPQAESDKE